MTERVKPDVFKSAVNSLSERLRSLDIENLSVSAYTIKYFRDYLRKLDYALESISLLLSEGLTENGKSIKNATLIDHGGGIGFVSLLAAEAGFRNVIYFDIYDVAAADAEKIANAVGIKSVLFTSGDFSDLKERMNQGNLSADVLVSRNVIEHIYDLEEFFSELKTLPSEKLSVAFSTTANKANPLTNIYTRRIQDKIEKKGLAGTWDKKRDSKEAYSLVRKKIIKELIPTVSEQDLNKLTQLTRGFIKSDIEKACQNFIATRSMPEPIEDAFNTCDPLTGNWTERLLPVSYYQSLFNKNGFSFRVVAGPYNRNYHSLPLKILSSVMNPLINMFGNRAYFLSPFIILCGSEKKK